MIVKLLKIKDITESDINKVEERLPSRYLKASKYRSREDFLRCIGVGVLLLKAYPDVDEKDITYNANGKPVFCNGEHFNASHSGSYVVLVRSDEPIGIDIEELDGSHLKMADKIFTEDELIWYNGDPLRRFYSLWTMKESLIKAIGTGLTTRLNTLNVLPFTKNKPVDINGETYFNRGLRYENYYISVTSKKIVDDLEIEE